MEDGPDGLTAEAWRKHLDRQLIAGQTNGPGHSLLGAWFVLVLYLILDLMVLAAGSAEPDGYLQVASLAHRCLNKQRKKRPEMTEVRTCTTVSPLVQVQIQLHV